MATVKIPDTINNAELLDRIIFEPSFFCKGRLAPSAFDLTAKKETYISVFRNKYYSYSGTKLPMPRNAGDRIAGVARLLTGDVRAISSPFPTNTILVSVEAKVTPRFPFHAGIFTTIDGVLMQNGISHTNPLFMYVQKRLVKLSTVLPDTELRPTINSSKENELSIQ